MKLKNYKMLIAALSLTMAATVPMTSMIMNGSAPALVSAAEEANEETQKIIYENEIKEVEAEGRVIYVGENTPLDLKEKVLDRLGIEDTDEIDPESVKVAVTGELIVDEEHDDEIITSNENLDGVLENDQGELTFSRSGYFLGTITYEDTTEQVIFHVGDEILSYVDLNDWAVEKGTQNPNFLKSTLVKFDDEKVKSVTADTADVNTDKGGEYSVTYTITSQDGEKTEQDVLVTVGDSKTVKELTDDGVWQALAGITITPAKISEEAVKTNPTPEVKSSNNKETNADGNTVEANNNTATDNSGSASTPETNDGGESSETVHTHQFDAGVVTKKPTCTEAGVKTYTCTECGETKTEEIPATGHTYGDAVVTKEPTCTEKGILTFTCTKCGEKKTEELDAVGHVYGDGIVTKKPTCTDKGVMSYTCKICGEVKEEEISELGHVEISEVTKEPTCTEPGVKTYTCTRCGATRTEEIAPLGHDETSEITKEATCTEAGARTYTCTRCGETWTEEIAPLGHEETSEITKEATCTEAGVRTYTCTRCGATRTEEIAPLGHEETSEITKEATCTEARVRTYTCTRCGSTRTEEIPAIGHDYQKVTTEATCVNDGSETYTCSHCGDSYTVTIPALGHNWEHHEATGHEEILEEAWTEYKEIWKVQCNGCGKYFDTADEAGNHVLESADDACENYTSVLVGYETIDHPAVTEWVVDTPAYDICTKCGEKHETE